MSILTSILFLGGYLLPFQSFIGSLNNSILDGLISGVTLGFKACIIIFGFVWVRASFPRVRYDQLMTVCWTVLLPLVFAIIFLVPCIIVAFDAVPTNISVLFFPGIVASLKKKWV
jgi:NADH-ubiquinone oxidoreductase chain 1